MGNPKALIKPQKDAIRSSTLHQKWTVKKRLIQFGILKKKKQKQIKKEYQ